MYEITAAQRAQPPYSSICYIRCDWADGTASRASGVVVGYNDVLTALHVVYDDSKGGWARSVTVMPGADTSPFVTTPFGSYTDAGSIVGRATNWDMNGDGLLDAYESSGDLALIGMRSRIGDVTGWLPVAQVPNDFYGTMVGYPARGTGMMAEAVYADASSYATVYDIGSSLGAGASGGPLLDASGGVTKVVGVLSGGSSYESTYAGLFSADTMNWLTTAMTANDTLLGYTPGSSQGPGSLYTGTSVADNFVGTAGRDTFNGRGGNDVLDGRGDIDLALYSGILANYQITVTSAATVQVRDLVGGRDGTDSLFNIERLKFTDVYVAFDTGGYAGQAYRLYQAAFDRAPDFGGLGFHINNLDNGVYITNVGAHFIASPEFSGKYGNLTDDAFVNQLYRNVLNREADAGGLAYHVQNLSSTHTRADVLVGFSESPENQANVIGAIQNGMIYTL
jgi:V8-like Glu-specific endopeptidase